jgi:hypothetical protein
MKRDSSHGRNKRSDFLPIRPAAALVSVGMILPEYLVILVVSAFLATMVLAIIQTIHRRDVAGHAEATSLASGENSSLGATDFPRRSVW